MYVPFRCGILKGCSAHVRHCALTPGPCPRTADSKLHVTGDSVSSVSFKGASLSLPRTGGHGGAGFSNDSILSELLGLCSDLIPATVSELELPQTSPDSGEEGKTGQDTN